MLIHHGGVETLCEGTRGGESACWGERSHTHIMGRGAGRSTAAMNAVLRAAVSVSLVVTAAAAIESCC